MNTRRYVVCGVGAIGGFLVGYGLVDENSTAAIAGAIVLVVASVAQEFAERRDPSLDPQRVLYLILLGVAGFLTGWGLAAESWLAVGAGVLLLLVGAGIMRATKQRDRQVAQPSGRED